MTNLVYNFIFETTPRKRTHEQTKETELKKAKSRKLLKTKSNLTTETRSNHNKQKEEPQLIQQNSTLDTQDLGTTVLQLKNSPYRNQIHLLPDKSKQDQEKPTLCLDLDQTLIYGSFEPFKDYDFVVPIDGFPDQLVYVKKRPHLEYFLKRCSELFEVVIYTASDHRYASPILDQIDPKNQYFRHRLYRHCCWRIEGLGFLKDLSILNRDISKVTLVDDSPVSFLLNPENGLHISPFVIGFNSLMEFDSEDIELLQVLYLFENQFFSSHQKKVSTQKLHL
ncbi:nuclear lim interactor-interacting factor-related [Anaeramoeba flamelloides]|uniref:Nuclear lim interactor-interacting factor-related n=1 Tax=Anaeramoeba flamelloides TaxID=1746091 RepID=A0ABQ8Z2Y8_9EUKA|nr:nuclear lim interactor-interacting factor-related [Anaeramoeba flamelloides]